ncbi:MAG TPA: histidine phosphatase family protein [Bryobacteraceae bacterium]|nr:histidine phosphatase family protein [Bryobacteraceae bacterium]
MSVLTLVRHGQASYMSEDYDRLSEVGERQARKLGEYWVRRGIKFHNVFSGPAKRHLRTAQIVADCFRDAGLPWPEPVVVPALDEFDAFQMMKAITPILVERDPLVRDLHARFAASQQTPQAGEMLQELFEAVARHWSSGEFDVPALESWASFRKRIAGGISEVRSTCNGDAAVAFTSGGPIAATTGLALDLSHLRSVELLWLSRNCSYSEYLVSNEHFLLASFNSHPHLEENTLLTYR